MSLDPFLVGRSMLDRLARRRRKPASARAFSHSRKAAYMKLPAPLQGESRTRLLQGIALGAVATVTVGFIWGGWVTSERAES